MTESLVKFGCLLYHDYNDEADGWRMADEDDGRRVRWADDEKRGRGRRREGRSTREKSERGG